MSRASWAKLTDAISGGASVVFDDPKVDTLELVAEGTRYLTRLLAGGINLPLSLRVVALDDVRHALPGSTRTVSPAERQASLRRRRLSVPRRLCD